MMISDMLSKYVGAMKSVLKKWFKINDIHLVHLLVVWYLVNIGLVVQPSETVYDADISAQLGVTLPVFLSFIQVLFKLFDLLI